MVSESSVFKNKYYVTQDMIGIDHFQITRLSNKIDHKTLSWDS